MIAITDLIKISYYHDLRLLNKFPKNYKVQQVKYFPKRRTCNKVLLYKYGPAYIPSKIAK